MTKPRHLAVTAGTTCLLALAACAADDDALARDPHPAQDRLTDVDTTGMWLPTQFETVRIVDPGWETPPQQLDGVFLAAGEHDGILEFTAVDSRGDVLWAAERPVSCTGFTLTTATDGRALAVLTDTATTGTALAGTTATAYDLTTGEEVWGPVDVPGPYQGPGLVFAAPPEEFIGETGPKTALDPTTGRVAAAEEHLDGGRIVGEYHGTLLLTDDEALTAHDTGDDHELWRLPLGDHGWSAESIRPFTGASPGDGLALVETSGGSGALVDLEDGTVLSDTAYDAATDPTTGVLVILDADGLHAHHSDGRHLWSHTVSPGTTIAALGGVFLYLRDADALRVHNVLTGDVAQAYDPHGRGRIIVPAHMAATGAALLIDGQRQLLGTAAPHPDPGHRRP